MKFLHVICIASGVVTGAYCAAIVPVPGTTPENASIERSFGETDELNKRTVWGGKCYFNSDRPGSYCRVVVTQTNADGTVTNTNVKRQCAEGVPSHPCTATGNGCSWSDLATQAVCCLEWKKSVSGPFFSR
ncbi:hypothetical protein BKA67DRAFT_646163 [Truncatella angustata]|uniref:Uncharacterized protein n=1 Tax=Truncatella angustata TaxID=152316 RepID=A0A9P8UM04_9PEZI|nr:uncharacterized protein BKA67DRAFT_646163 [Truncatella angustata]KAH6654435.1 hypothetical protein BKA67DRAFT_646163 [Truncatella angustata]